MKRNSKLLIIVIIIITVISLTACMSEDNREKTTKRVLVEAVKRRADDTLWGKTRYKYDKYGRKIEQLTKEEGKTVIKHKWKYDKRGNVIKEYILDLRMGKIEKKHIRKFDSEDRLIEHKIINDTKYLPDYQHYKYKYNEQGELIEKKTLNESGELICRSIYDYDQDGRKILYKYINDDGEELRIKKWEYNDQGKETYYVEIFEGEEISKIISEFDKKVMKFYIKNMMMELENIVINIFIMTKEIRLKK